MMVDHLSDSDYENEYETRPTKLTKALKIGDLLSEKGALFEIEKDDIEPTIFAKSSVEDNTQSKMWGICSGGTLQDIDNENNDLAEGCWFTLSEVQFALTFCADTGPGLDDVPYTMLQHRDLDDLEPFDKLAQNMEDISGDGCILKMELQPGIGTKVHERARVTFHYSAFLEFADEPFDSTLLRGQPQQVRLDSNALLPGLQLAVKTMCLKERARFLVQSQYAFGVMGCPPRIPGGATILYEVTLINSVDTSPADDFEQLDSEQQRASSFEDRMKVATAYFHEGNEHFRTAAMGKARRYYRRAVTILEISAVADVAEERRWNEILFRLHSNLAQVHLDSKEASKACTECRLALDFNTDNVPKQMKAKLFYRFAKAKMFLNDYEDALKYIRKAQRFLPNNSEISSLIEEVIRREHDCEEREKIMCQRMIGMSLKPTDTDDSSKPLSRNQGCISGSPYCQKSHSNSLVSMELQSLLSEQIDSFTNDPDRTEHPLPPNLTNDELEFVTKMISHLQMKVKKFYTDSQTVWKIVK